MPEDKSSIEMIFLKLMEKKTRQKKKIQTTNKFVPGIEEEHGLCVL